MSELLVATINYLFGWTVITLVLSWVLAGIYPLLSNTLTDVKVSVAGFFLFIYGLLAPITATIALVLLSLPTFTFPLITNHCHGSICAPHKLHMMMETVEGVLAVSIGVVVLASVGVLMILQLLSSRRYLKALSNLSEIGSPTYRMVESQASVAWCAGLFKPQVYLLTGLLERHSPQQIQIILAHEFAHVFRRDNLRKWVLHWATYAWPKSRKQRIRQEFSNYIEQACDLTAARLHQSELDTSAVVTHWPVAAQIQGTTLSPNKIRSSNCVFVLWNVKQTKHPE